MTNLLLPLRALVLAALVLGGTGVTVLEHVAAFGANDYCPDPQERAFLKLINDYRARHGRDPVKLSRTLGAAAEHHSRDMAKRNYFSHEAPHGTGPTERAEQYGYDCGFFCGETILWGTVLDRAAEALDVWQRSREHDANMLDPNWKSMSISRHYDRDYVQPGYRGEAYIWTTVFGEDPAPGPRC